MHNPVYFNYGVAVHGSGNVPNRPASHGCIRIPMHISEYFPTLVERGDQIYVWDGVKEPEVYGRQPPPFDFNDPDYSTTTTATTTPPSPRDDDHGCATTTRAEQRRRRRCHQRPTAATRRRRPSRRWTRRHRPRPSSPAVPERLPVATAEGYVTPRDASAGDDRDVEAEHLLKQVPPGVGGVQLEARITGTGGVGQDRQRAALADGGDGFDPPIVAAIETDGDTQQTPPACARRAGPAGSGG